MSVSDRQRELSRATGSTDKPGRPRRPRSSSSMEEMQESSTSLSIDARPGLRKVSASSSQSSHVPGSPGGMSLESEHSGYLPAPLPSHALRKVSASSTNSRRPSSSAASYTTSTQSGRMSVDSNQSAYTASQSPSLAPSVPKSKGSRSKILASSANALDTSPPAMPFNPQPYASRNGIIDAAGFVRSSSPSPAGKGSIVLNTSSGTSILERKKRLASASGSTAFDEGLTDSSSISSKSARMPSHKMAVDQSSILSSASNTSLGATSPRRDRHDLATNSASAVPPSSPPPAAHGGLETLSSAASPPSFKSRLWGLRKDRRQGTVSQGDEEGEIDDGNSAEKLHSLPTPSSPTQRQKDATLHLKNASTSPRNVADRDLLRAPTSTHSRAPARAATIPRPSTSDSRYERSSNLGSPRQDKPPSPSQQRLTSSASVPQLLSSPVDTAVARFDQNSGSPQEFRMGPPVDADSASVHSSAGVYAPSRSGQNLRTALVDVAPPAKGPTDYGEVLRQSRRMRSNSKGSASIRSVASHVSSSSPVPLRTTSLKQERGGGGVPSSPLQRHPQRPEIVSASSSYKSASGGSAAFDARSIISQEDSRRSARGSQPQVWRHSLAPVNAAAGPSGAGALAAIRASFGEPPGLADFMLNRADTVSGRQSPDADDGDGDVSASGAPQTALAKPTKTGNANDTSDEMEELRAADDMTNSANSTMQPLRPTKSPLRTRMPSSTASESSHTSRSASAPMTSSRDRRFRSDTQSSHLAQQLSPPRKSLEEMPIADAVYRRGDDSFATSGSFPSLAQSVSDVSLHARARGNNPPTPTAAHAASSTSMVGSRNQSASTISLAATDEEAEGDEQNERKSAASKSMGKRYKTLRKVTPPTLSKFGKNHSRHTSGPADMSTASMTEDASPAVANGGQRKKSIWRLGLGKDDNDAPPVPTASSAAMTSSKSKLGISIRGRKSEPAVPARPTIRRVFDMPGANGSTSLNGNDTIGDLTMSDAASTVTRDHTLMSSQSRESILRASGNESPIVYSSSVPGTPLTPSESLPTHLKQLMRRFNAIREMVETERSYAADLVVVREVYLLRAKALAGMPLASPLQTPMSLHNTPVLSPASLIGPPASAPAQSSGYARGTPPAQWSGHSVSNRGSSDAPMTSNSPLAGISSSSASHTAGTSSGPWSNRSSTYTTSSHASSDVSFQWPPNPHSLPGTPSIGQASSTHKGSSGLAAAAASPNPSLQLNKGLPRLHTSPSVAILPVADPPMSASDIRVIFAYLEACVALAQDLSSLLQAAIGSAAREHITPTSAGGNGTIASLVAAESDDDAIGRAFLSMMPRIEYVFTAYCSRHETAMQRLQQLNATSPKAAAYLRECTEVARKQTTAWDLGSLLIKPVQRVLKYPLLLRQILGTTDAKHPDYKCLTEALDQIQVVADKINQVKRRRDLADHIITGRDRDAKTALHSPLSSAPSKSKRKMVLARQPSNGDMRLTDDALDAAAEQYGEILKHFEALQSRVGIFGRQCGAWSYALRECYYAQLRMMGCLRRVYGLRLPTDEEAATATAAAATTASSSSSRLPPVCPEDALVAEYMNVLKTIINRSWRQMDTEVRTTILPMTAKLDSMFEAPRLVIAKRDERESDYVRCRTALQQAEGASSKALDRKALDSADGFVALQGQLIDELPFFLQSVQIVLDVGVQAFARVQAAHMDEVRNMTLDFWSNKAGHSEEVDMVGLDDEDMLNVGPTLRHINPVRAFWEAHKPIAQWSDSLSIARRESELTTVGIDIDDATDMDLNDGRETQESAPQPFSMSMLASMPSGTPTSAPPIFTSPFEQTSGGKGNGPSMLRLPPSPSSGFAPTATRRPTGVAGLMMRTLSGTFSRDTTPSPSASGGEVAPPMPHDAASNVRMYRDKASSDQLTPQPPSPLLQNGSERTSVASSRGVSAVAPTLPSLVFRNEAGEDGGEGGDGFFIQNAPIAFLDTPEAAIGKEPYDLSPSLMPAVAKTAVPSLPESVAGERQSGNEVRGGDALADYDDDDGEHSRSSSFVSAESARSRLLRRSSAVTALQQQYGGGGGVDGSEDNDHTVTQGGAFVEMAATATTMLPQRQKMHTLFRCVALQDSSPLASGVEEQDYLGWPFVEYHSGDTFRVVSTDAKAPSTTTSPDSVKLFGRLDRTGQLGWVEKAHFTDMEDEATAAATTAATQ